MAGIAGKSATYGKKVIDHDSKDPKTVTIKEWVQDSRFANESPKTLTTSYLLSLFPILSWIGRYNVGWLTGDLLAGITVGIVLVPQSMSYATIATLSPQYGLYSSFVGVMIYCLFATSKDVSIGPVAVMSLTVARVIAHVQHSHGNTWTPELIATTLSFICGFIVLGIGLLRIGWIVEWIPAPAVSGFMTGSAINIVSGQVAGLMGIPNINTRGATYHVIIDTLKGLPNTHKDAAFGLVGLVFLYFWRWSCNRLARKYPRRVRWFVFLGALRNGFVIVILTLASWLYVRHKGVYSKSTKKTTYPIKVLGTVPRGFQHLEVFTPDASLIRALASQLPVATIILVLEHLAISRSFGRVNGYKIDPNQELIAIGVTNTVGTVFHAYPATGSFSRSALKSKSGVRTPLAGIFTGVVVVVALYGLTPAFTWIPTAGLSAIIIHAVADLVASPAQVYAFWKVSPLEWLIWVAAVLVTVFVTIEWGIYTAIIASAVLIAIRLSFPRGKFLGRASVANSERDIFLPLDPSTQSTPDASHGLKPSHSGIEVLPPADGVVIYRQDEAFLYPNAYRLNEKLVDHIKATYRRNPELQFVQLADRSWNDPGPRHGDSSAERETNLSKPVLRAVVLDFSGVAHLDTTAVQVLIDTRKEVEKWIGSSGTVEWHFAGVVSPWVRRALVSGKFGFNSFPSSSNGGDGDNAPAYDSERSSFKDLERGLHPELDVVPYRDGRLEPEKHAAVNDAANPAPHVDDIEAVGRPQPAPLRTSQNGKEDWTTPRDTPYLHYDLISAVRAAEASASSSSSHQAALEKKARAGNAAPAPLSSNAKPTEGNAGFSVMSAATGTEYVGEGFANSSVYAGR